jgi:hypothetical protein
MALRYYMDVHVPSVIAEGLRRRGIDVLTSQEDGTREADDESLLQRATDLRRILFSQDADLLRIANEWQTRGRSFAGVIFAHQQRTGVGPLVNDLELIGQCCKASEVADRVIFLPLD